MTKFQTYGCKTIQPVEILPCYALTLFCIAFHTLHWCKPKGVAPIEWSVQFSQVVCTP